jgi:antitoxin HicB
MLLINLRNSMAEEYTIHLKSEKVENDQYLATSEVLSGLVAQGRTIAETVEIAQDAARKLLDSYTINMGIQYRKL